MKTIYHLIRHRTTLEVICTSCTHSGVLYHRYLANRFGMTKLLVEIRSSVTDARTGAIG